MKPSLIIIGLGNPGKIPAAESDFIFAAIGEDIRAAWLEVSYDKFDWQRVTRYFFKAPYFWTFGREAISKDMFYLRAAAQDNLENIGYSMAITVPAVPAAPAAPAASSEDLGLESED